MNKKAWLILIALSGTLITGYLSYVHFTNTVPFCGTEGITGCSTVVASHYAKIGFVPVAFAGFVAWLSLLFIAFLLWFDDDNKRAAHKIGLGITAVGIVAAGYFNGVMFFKLGAFCPWCESAHSLMVLYFFMLAQGVFTTKRLLKSLIAGLLLFALPFGAVGFDGANNADASLLVDCLSEKNVVMYGTYWCPHCKEQKALFGESFERIKYIECAEKDNPRQQTAECKIAGIKQYPTWIKDTGDRITGTQSLESLKEWAGC
ncbi:hypothetical protein HY485_03240 [Candidatus Woesearchaeota archaeon]|nr:hypothetical protein [Candidatus Woesearchaeota archaeon]